MSKNIESEHQNFLMAKFRSNFEKTLFNGFKRLKFPLDKLPVYPLLCCVFLLLIIFFRGYLFCLFGFLNCYITWPLTSPLHVKLDLFNLSMNQQGNEYIPRRLHHILLGPLSSSPPLNWLLARNSCLELHSHYEKHYYWTDQNSDLFLSENYPWFLKTWNSYGTTIQKADALRYFVLYHYGGIFLDMDLFCRQRLDGILNYLGDRISSSGQIFFAVKAFPVGISNGFLITTAKHPLLRRVMENLELYNRNFLLPHATIVISTGPMCISIQIQLNRSLWSSILVLDGKENMLGGKTDTPLFKHLGSGSWHQADDIVFKNIPMNVQHQSQTFSISIIIFLICMCIVLIEKNKNWIKVSGMCLLPSRTKNSS